MQKLWWDIMYLLGKTPWDTNITPPEVRAVVEGKQVTPGRALDLGCGTGTNVIYLAQHGFDTTGVDLSTRAIARARQKIKLARLEPCARVYAGDVTRLDALPVTGPFNLVLDIGCLHNLDVSARQRYASGLLRRMQPGGLYLLYAFGPRLQRGQRSGLSPAEAEQLFAPALKLERVVHGEDRGGITAAWYTFYFPPP